ncbi:MAG: peptidoglycan-associated lipoprotein Pal [Zetaproteobacteria bacterium]|nr:MAG: peptidoglycan-associated lipoprotein Pal [Zetaproteobacteria bacterium]
MSRSRSLSCIVIVAAALTFAGCAKKEVVGADHEGAARHQQSAAAQEPSTSGVQEMNGSGASEVARPTTNSIYFAFDSAAIDAAGLAVLDRHAAWLRAHPGVSVTIEGNCDERGSREYNLALGQQRADAVRAHLIAQGVDGSRIDTVSFGEERPVCTGSGEACWAQNRRADIVVH